MCKIEQTLCANLDSWGLDNPIQSISLTLGGHQLSAIRVEQTYKGNFHLLANVDGIERKFVIVRNKEEYAYIENTGILNLSEENLATMLIKKYLLH